MTNEELDHARATEAVRLRLLPGFYPHEAVIAARLAREGWTPPQKPINADLDWSRRIVGEMFKPLYIADYISPNTRYRALDYVLFAIQKGRELAQQEQAK